jgi:TM2 domain-containing membrane protein YozV
MKKENEKYCFECGQIINAKAEICPKCGVRQPGINSNSGKMSAAENKWLICLLLCWFVGIFGVHRFYTGYKGLAVLQLLTLGGCGIWVLVDFIMIAIGNFKDAEGNVIKSAY